MKLLIIDTTKLTAFIVAVCDELNYVKIIPETQKHSEELLNGIETLLNGAGVELKDFDAVGCVTGPGSFTGIRIGMSTVKAFVCANNLKLISGTFFDIIGSYVKNGTVILKNTNKTCYLAQISNAKVKNSEVVEYSKLDSFKSASIYALEQEHLQNQLSYINISTINNYPEILASYFVNKFNKKQFDDINSFSPYYMQLSQAERELKDKRNDKETK